MIQQQCQVVWNLTAGGYYHALGSLHITYVQYTFQCKLIKEQAVTGIVVGTYGLRVVVYHDRTVTHLLDLLYGSHTAPVKLNG